MKKEEHPRAQRKETPMKRYTTRCHHCHTSRRAKAAGPDGLGPCYLNPKGEGTSPGHHLWVMAPAAAPKARQPQALPRPKAPSRTRSPTRKNKSCLLLHHG